jgi:hypothetical protein
MPTNPQLRAEFSALSNSGATIDDIIERFGQPPYYFLEGLPPPYAKFTPQYTDSIGREYQELDDSQLACRIPIALRRRSPTVEFPLAGAQIELKSKTDRRTVRVVSVWLSEGRRATAALQISG